MTDLRFVHRFMPSASGSLRLLLLLHGTGGDESDLLPLGREIDPEAALLSPRGKVSENGSLRFFRRFAEGVFDEEDVVRRANELADFVAAAAEEYSFELENVVAVGYSNGANIAAAILFLRPEIFRSAVLFRAMVPLSAPEIPALSRTRVLISSGAHDSIIPAAQAQHLAALLRNAGANVEVKLQEASHGLISEDLAVARRWLDP